MVALLFSVVGARKCSYSREDIFYNRRSRRIIEKNKKSESLH